MFHTKCVCHIQIFHSVSHHYCHLHWCIVFGNLTSLRFRLCSNFGRISRYSECVGRNSKVLYTIFVCVRRNFNANRIKISPHEYITNLKMITFSDSLLISIVTKRSFARTSDSHKLNIFMLIHLYTCKN